MDRERIDADLRAAVEERLAARLEGARQRRDARQQRLAELSARRRAGLRTRHARKLERLQQQRTADTQPKTPGGGP